MRYNGFKKIALSIIVTGLLVGCGNSSDAQRTLTNTDNLTNKEKQLEVKITKYLASTTLPTLHILPTMSDEDGNTQDAKATYTLTANKDVTVKIETPDGSWNTPMWRYNNNPLPLVIRTNRGNAMTLNL